MTQLLFQFISDHVWDIIQALFIAVVTAVLTPVVLIARTRRIKQREKRS